MKNREKTKVQLINELGKLRRQIVELKESEKRLKQAERALRESENKYRTLVKNLPQKVFIKDKNSVYITCNENYARDLKIGPNEIVGRTDYDFYPKKLADKYRKDDKRIMASGKTEDIEEKYIQNGEEVWVHTVKTPIKDKKNKSIGILGIFWDITESKQMAEALKQSEERFRGIAERSVDVICTLDMKGCVTYASPAVERILGYKPEEIISKPIWNYVPKSELPKAIRDVTRVIKGKKIEELEIKFLRKDESIAIVEINSTLIHGDGEVIGLQGILRDITERKRAEEKLREREMFNYALFEYNPMATMVVDLEGKITGFNLAKRKSGDRLPHIGEVMFKDYAGGHEIDMHAEMMESIRSGKTKHFPEQRYGNKILSVTISPFPKGAVIISQDITESKRAEQQIKTALEEKEVLLREIHHRVKNNLQIVSSMINLQSSSIKDDRVLEIFEESQNRIKTMVLIHEKLYRSNDLSHIDVKEYIKSLTGSLVRSFGLRGGRIALTTEIGDITLSIDKIISCGMIINELVSNSLKYAFLGRKSGNINIKMQWVEGKMIELIVRDDGIGMPEDLDFRNAESLGLQLVTMLAEGQLRGKINLERKGGTEFHIRFSGVE